MNGNKFYLAADSGGSKTLWVLLDSIGNILCEYKSAGMGAAENGLLPVHKSIFAAKEHFKQYGHISAIYLSLGGANTDEVRSALEEAFSNAAITVEREANGNSILYAASLLGCSGVVMCGTGSTAVGIKNGQRTYCGGWGAAYGDGGSGFGIGADALKAYLKHIDGCGSIGKTADLFCELEKGLNIKSFPDRMELKRRVLNMTRREIAALAPGIYTLMKNGDLFAAKLYENAADEIALMANAVSDGCSSKILLCGGLFAGKPEFIEMCRKKSEAILYYNSKFNPINAACISVLRENCADISDKFKSEQCSCFARKEQSLR